MAKKRKKAIQFGKKLAAIAKRQKRSHFSIAKEMSRKTGVNASNVYEWFNGYCKPRDDNFSALCEVLGVDSAEEKLELLGL